MRSSTLTGRFSAIDGICPHQGGGRWPTGALEGTTVTCPWHGWQFDVRTGKTPLGPKIKQAVYEVKIEGTRRDGRRSLTDVGPSCTIGVNPRLDASPILESHS